MNEIKNVREGMTVHYPMNLKKKAIWENLQLVTLFGTILGQILVGGLYFAAQSIWLACNVLALTRDFVLDRPKADKIKNAGLCGVTVALIALRACGIY